jgi:hypothetical protein
VVSEEKIFRNQPIRNKNRIWWPCLLTDRDGMSILYREPSIDASYQVSDHLAKQFQRRRFLEINHQKHELPVVAMFVNGLERNVHS